jgi:hypothetical protein
MSEPEQAPTPAPPPRCGQCGAPTPPRAAEALPSPLPDDADEAGTHCEWCGAEYTVPERT